MTAAAGFGGPWPWVLLAGYGLLLWLVAPRSRDGGGFYAGTDGAGRPPSLAALTASLFIAWIFAKSVTKAANWGATFGMPGVVAYAAYWLSLPVAGLAIVGLRRRFGATSLASWLTVRYGAVAAGAFLFLMGIRLYNEVWGNGMALGTYFGPPGTAHYYLGAMAFTAITLGYTLKGGLRTAIATNALQAGLFAVCLALVLVLALPRATGGHVERVLTAGSWTLAGGLDLLLVVLLQALSYPFHDPVLTDRAFLTDTRTTLRAFCIAGAVGALAIALCGTIGVAAFLHRTPFQEDAPRVVAAAVGAGVLVLMNVVMLSSATAAVNAAFSAMAKAFAVDVAELREQPTRRLAVGRGAMVVGAALGSLPLFAGEGIITATTVTGTMVMGLAPIFLVGPFVDAPRLSFHLAFWVGIVLGALQDVGLIPPGWAIGSGQHAILLGVNARGLALVTLLFCAPVVWRRLSKQGRTPQRATASVTARP